jgi:hypothetical protein
MRTPFTESAVQRGNGNGGPVTPKPPLPGADPVATDEELWEVWDLPRRIGPARRAIYARGRADERTAILRALGVEP